MVFRRTLTLVIVAGLAGLSAYGQERKGDPYTLDHCIVSGAKFESQAPVVKTYDGREVRFCSVDCSTKFETGKDEFVKKLDAEMIAQQKADYPTVQCVSMPEDKIDEDLDFILNNRLFRVCCEDCVDDIKKDPAKYTAKIDKAVVEKQKDSYPLKTGVVSDESLDGSHGEVVEHVVANRLVRLCCTGCVKGFEKEPAKYLAKIDAAKGTPKN